MCRNCWSPPAPQCSAIRSISLDDGLLPNYLTEAHVYAKHILAAKPGAKIAVLYQNDDFGKDYLIGHEEALAPIAQR